MAWKMCCGQVRPLDGHTKEVDSVKYIHRTAETLLADHISGFEEINLPSIQRMDQMVELLFGGGSH